MHSFENNNTKYESPEQIQKNQNDYMFNRDKVQKNNVMSISEIKEQTEKDSNMKSGYFNYSQSNS